METEKLRWEDIPDELGDGEEYATSGIELDTTGIDEYLATQSYYLERVANNPVDYYDPEDDDTI